MMENTESKNLISYDEIRGPICRSKAHHIFLISDACFSGIIFRSGDRSIKSITSEEIASFIDKKDSLSSRHALSAGGVEKVSDGIQTNNSPLTSRIIEFLEENKQQEIPVSELMDYVKLKVNHDTRSGQTPEGGLFSTEGHNGGEFIFRKKIYRLGLG